MQKYWQTFSKLITFTDTKILTTITFLIKNHDPCKEHFVGMIEFMIVTAFLPFDILNILLGFRRFNLAHVS